MGTIRLAAIATIVFLCFGQLSCDDQKASSYVDSDVPKGPFPWLENLVKLPMPSELKKYATNETDILTSKEERSVVPDTISDSLKPFINATAVKEMRAARNRSRTEDEVVTDEDVADIPDDDDPLNKPVYDGKKTTIPISEDAGVELYQHWLDQAVSGLMAVVATNKMEHVYPEDRKVHHKCSKGAKTVKEHAKCVAKLLELKNRPPRDKKNELKPTKTNQKPVITKARTTTQKSVTTTPTKASLKPVIRKVKPMKTTKVKAIRKLKKIRKSKKLRKNSKSSSRSSSSSMERPIKRLRFTERGIAKARQYKKKMSQWNGKNSFRMRRLKRDTEGDEEGELRREKRKSDFYDVPKRKIVQRTSYTLESKPAAFAALAKKLTMAVRAFKGKDLEKKPWQETIEEIREEGNKLKKKAKAKKLMKKRFDMFTNAMRDVGVDPSRALDTMGVDFYKDDPELSEKEELLQEAKDIEKKLTKEDKLLREPIKLIRQGVKLAMTLTGQDTTNFENKTLKMISPKIMSLIPEEEDSAQNTINVLSPSLFTLHNDTGPNELSLSKMLNVFDQDGQQEWMNFVFEASGVSDAVGYMKDMKIREDRDEMMEKMKGPDGQPMQFSKDNVTEILGDFERMKIERMEKLHGMFTKEQMDGMNSTGYVTMTPEQLEFVYGPASPYNNSAALNRLSNLTELQVNAAIEKTIDMIAKEQMAFRVQRQHDVVLTPVFYQSFINDPVGTSQALILSPVFMTPLIYSPSIFGSVILSPWAFVPVILSPRILGPVVLSPILFAPVVLSPLALVPLILSPGVGVPFVLSPFALCPFILSPVVLTPIILSPFVLSPFIMIPNVLSPLILSPFVLSPLILSPPAFSAFVLNPYALSPVIKSDGAVFTAVLSPSWLS